MSSQVSAGLLLYRGTGRDLKVLLAHPGGPFFARKDEGHWTIPKGEVEPGEDLLATAIRELKEETGIALAAEAQFIPLGCIRQKGGKVVHAWAAKSDWDDTQPVQSNTFEMEWPPGSGRRQSFPEVDRVEFFDLASGKLKIKPAQRPLIDRLAEHLGPDLSAGR